ncbi:hypothetical protein BHU72_02740 [Desulfuribacillus stibiiarsenatis]|uniref:Uncharacterized protein n=1 Tax=Desulfuribacillus stibiiarsenatis TaxID=1390249 RepID=A0A1E5L6D9_9FIRM|nr:hypothetical protein [Desulfuribacillus stibiiarsenatis]OEH85727.1 hypothetical protein BHU72_02740 [Desulfuribacillus stibiiarsenatis]
MKLRQDLHKYPYNQDPVYKTYDHNFALNILKHPDEIQMFEELMGSHDEVLTEFVKVCCSQCDCKFFSPQVIVNPYGYGTEGAMVLDQHHSCHHCGASSNIEESIFKLLGRVKEYLMEDTLDYVG